MAAAARDIRFACRCGALTGHLAGAHPDDGFHLTCGCRDCTAAARHFGDTDPDIDGVHIYWIAPDRIVFDSGFEKLAVLSLHPDKRLLRWYAACCGTAIVNTQPTRSIFIAGVIADRLGKDPAIGPLRGRAFVQKPGGGSRHENGMAMMGYVLRQTLGARFSGRVARHPLFDATIGDQILTPAVLGEDARPA
jgi:hypothetical protein